MRFNAISLRYSFTITHLRFKNQRVKIQIIIFYATSYTYVKYVTITNNVEHTEHNETCSSNKKMMKNSKFTLFELKQTKPNMKIIKTERNEKNTKIVWKKFVRSMMKKYENVQIIWILNLCMQCSICRIKKSDMRHIHPYIYTLWIVDCFWFFFFWI